YVPGDQVVSYGIRALLRKPGIILVRSLAVGMSRYFNLYVWVIVKEFQQPVQFRKRFLPERSPVKIKKDVVERKRFSDLNRNHVEIFVNNLVYGIFAGIDVFIYRNKTFRFGIKAQVVVHGQFNSIKALVAVGCRASNLIA